MFVDLQSYKMDFYKMFTLYFLQGVLGDIDFAKGVDNLAEQEG
jgi:hypothetical protein